MHRFNTQYVYSMHYIELLVIEGHKTAEPFFHGIGQPSVNAK